MTQVNGSIPSEIQAAIDNNDFMVVGQFLIIPNLRDCSQESLEVFAQAFEILRDRSHCWLLENTRDKSLANEFDFMVATGG